MEKVNYIFNCQVPSHELVEICTKALYQVELARNNLEQMWGFSVEAELVENTERQDELCVFVSRVEDRSVAMNHGTYGNVFVTRGRGIHFPRRRRPL